MSLVVCVSTEYEWWVWMFHDFWCQIAIVALLTREQTRRLAHGGNCCCVLGEGAV